jgi:uncharacterized membrane protein
MEKLTPEFLAGCRRSRGRILRGENMTRIETFVDAAFAFAFTMLVISIDEIPESPPELLALSRDIPAFIISAAIIGAVWLAHATWSRTFGLQDGATVFLSLGLVMLVLIFVYPIKLMVQATVFYLSRGALGINVFDTPGWENNSVADLFVYFSLGLIALSIIIICLYQNALRFREELDLNSHEKLFCQRNTLSWAIVVMLAIGSVLIGLFVDGEAVVAAGFIYFVLWPLDTLAIRLFNRRVEQRAAQEQT